MASSAGVIFAISSSRASITKRSALRSCFHDGKSISARSILTLPPVLSSDEPRSSMSGKSSSSKSASSNAFETSVKLAALPVLLKLSILARALVWLSCKLSKVSRKEATELSKRFSKLMVISACRLFSRSACFNLPPPEATSVSYRASYFFRRLGKM